MPKTSYRKSVIALVVILIIAGVGFASLTIGTTLDVLMVREFPPELEATDSEHTENKPLKEPVTSHSISPSRLCEKRGLVVRELMPGNFQTDEANGLLVLCWNLGSVENHFYYDTGHFILLEILSGTPHKQRIIGEATLDTDPYMTGYTWPILVDVNNDGIHEIYWTGKTYGGYCISGSEVYIIYSITYAQKFYVQKSWGLDDTCTKVTGSSALGFSWNFQDNEEYEFLKEYLHSMATSEDS